MKELDVGNFEGELGNFKYSFLLEVLIKREIGSEGLFDSGKYFYTCQMAFLPQGRENSISFN